MFRRIALLIACVAATQAHADDTPSPRPTATVVYAGVEASTLAAGRAATLVELLTEGRVEPETPLQIDDLFAAGELGIHGAEDWEVCLGPPISPEAYAAQVEDLYGATTRLEDTSSRIHALEAAQTCLTGPAVPVDLSRVPFLEAVTAFGTGDVEGARAAFADVFVVNPDHTWDPEYPPDAQLLFANAGTRVLRRGLAHIRLVAPAGAELWVDGRTARLEEPAPVPPGRHLVQLRTAPEQPLLSVAVVVQPRETAAVLVRAALDKEAPQEGIAAINAALGETRSPTIDWYLQLWPTLAVWSWDERAAVLQPVEITAAIQAAITEDGEAVARRQQRLARALPALIGAGVAMTVAGTVLAGVGGGRASSMAADAEEDLPFVHPDDPAPTAQQQANTDAFENARTAAGIGVGLIALGGASLAVTIPWKVRLDRAPRVTDVTVSAVVWPPGEGPPATSPGGFGVQVTFR